MKNTYEICGDVTYIYYINSKGERLKTIIDTKFLAKVKSIPNTWIITPTMKGSRVYRPYTRINGRKVYLYRFIMNPQDNEVVDHINRDTLDNRVINLRNVSQSVNTKNLGTKVKSKTGIRNVIYNPRDNKYRVRLTVNGKKKDFGQYECIKEAEKVAVNARELYVN